MKVVAFKHKWMMSCALALGAYALDAHPTLAQQRVAPGCACATDCTTPGSSVPTPAQPGDPLVEPDQTAPAPSLADEQFASLGGDTVSLVDTAPNVIGDFFGNGCVDASFTYFDSFNSLSYDYDVCIPTPGSTIGRVKLADNNSPLPRDRVFFDYNYFHNTSVNGVNVNRYTPGFEKTFHDGIGSLEFRMPMANTLGSDVVIDSATGVDRTGLDNEFGDLFLGMKLLVATTDVCALTAGLGVSLPTADDVRVGLSDGTTLAVIENEAVYVSPYAAVLLTPSSTCFFQGFVQFNVDANGNEVYANSVGTGLLPVGRLNEQSTVFLDASVGHWIFRDFTRRGPHGVALMLEAHYSATIEDADVLSSNGFQFGNSSSDLDVLNATIGTHFLMGQSVFTIGYTAPVSGDETFDGEFRAFVNRYF